MNITPKNKNEEKNYRKFMGIIFPLCIFFIAIVNVKTAESSSNLLGAGDIVYEGAFAVPKDSGMSGGGPCLGMSQNGNLYICGSQDGNLTEINIPTPVKSTVLSDLTRAEFLHPYVDITKGKEDIQEDLPNSGRYDFGDVLQVGNNICWTIYEYYNGDGSDHLSFGCTESLDASESSGLWHIGPFANENNYDFFHAVQTADYLSHNYNADTTGCLLSGRTRAAGAFGGSKGPAVYEFCPPSIAQAPGTAIESASVLLSFPGEFPFPKYKPKDMWRGVEVLGRTVLMVVRKSLGPVFYKHGPRPEYNYPDDLPQELCGTEGGGYHAGPYEAQFQLFDWETIKEVKNGQREPWDVLPYLTLPIPGWWDICKKEIGDMTYDPVNRRVYITQMRGDNQRPIVHVYRIVDSGNGEEDIQPPSMPIGFQVN